MKDATTSLRKEKQDLEICNQKMVTTLVYSNDKMYILQGAIDSLKNEIVALALIETIIIHSLKSQIEDLRRLVFFYNIDDFLPLIRAYNGERAVTTQGIKIGVIKAIEVLLGKVTSNVKLTETLS